MMSDIQRYTIPYDNDRYAEEMVKYDDHIAELERRYELWQAKYKERTTELQASNKRKRAKIKAQEKSTLKIMGKMADHINELQARIDELEAEAANYVYKTVMKENQIKAEGVEEYGEHLCYVRDGFEAMTPEQFANKLRSE